jgi:hypothetical protein
MQPKMTKAELRAWMARWKLVNNVQIEEARLKTSDERLSELDALFAFGSCPSTPRDDAAVEAVRQRWARLKAHAHAR